MIKHWLLLITNQRNVNLTISIVSPSDINNRESSSGFISNGHFLSFRKGGLDTAGVPQEDLKMQELNNDMIDNLQPENIPVNEPNSPILNPLDSLNLENSLVLLKDKIVNEKDKDKINEIKMKIKEMINFYDH